MNGQTVGNAVIFLNRFLFSELFSYAKNSYWSRDHSVRSGYDATQYNFANLLFWV